MRQNWISYYIKPEKWKSISPMVYSNIIDVFLPEDRISMVRTTLVGQLELRYKLLNREKIDLDFTTNHFIELFGRNPAYDKQYFKRDGDKMIYISKIFLSEAEYKNIIRKQKLERILKL